MNQLAEDKAKLSDLIQRLTAENQSLTARLHSLTRLTERREAAGSESRSRSFTPQRSTKTDKEMITEYKLSDGTCYRQLHDAKSPVRMEMIVDDSDINRLAIGVHENGRHVLGRNLHRSHGKQVIIGDKENVSSNYDTEGKALSGQLKKLIGAWSQVADLLSSFDKLAVSFGKMISQIEKDKNRIEHLSNKKRDLAPYARDIAKLLSGVSLESLINSKEALESNEKDYINRSISYFEKLTEEYGYTYGTYAEKLKSRKAEYIRWNKRLAAYCQQAYPNFSN